LAAWVLVALTARSTASSDPSIIAMAIANPDRWRRHLLRGLQIRLLHSRPLGSR
jgi:hypothetical protein